MTLHWIEFIGGPLDGHTYSCDHPADRLPEMTRLEISPDVIRVLTGERQNSTDRPTSTAVYSLDRSGTRLRYVHLASIGVETRQLGSA